MGVMRAMAGGFAMAVALAAADPGGARGGAKAPENAATMTLSRGGLPAQPPRIDPAMSPLHHPGFEVFAPTGGVYHERHLFDLEGGRHRLPVTLRRLSLRDVTYDGPYGRNWWLSLHSFLSVDGSGAVTLHDTDGRADVFEPEGDGYRTPAGMAARLDAVRRGTKVKGWTLLLPDGNLRAYDAKGKWKTWTRPDGQVVKFVSGPDLRLKKVTTPEKRTWSFRYGKDRRLASIALPGGRTIAFTYGPLGDLVAVARPVRAGVDTTPRAWTYAYDGSARLVEVRGSGGGLVGAVAHDGDGRVASITDFAGKVAAFAWSGSVLEGTDRDGARWDVAFDGAGQVVSRTVYGLDGGPESESFEHDTLLRRTAWTGPAGNREEWEFAAGTDPLERHNVPVHRRIPASAGPSAVDVELVTTRAHAGGTGLVLAEVGPGGARTDFAYDGWLVASVTGPAILTETGSQRPTTLFEYDAFGRRTAVVHPGGSRDTYAYVKKPRDLVAAVVRDAGSDAGRANLRTRWTYDAAGRLATTTLDDGSVRRQVSDAWDRVTEITDGRGVTTSIEYDADGNAVVLRTPLRDADGAAVGDGEAVRRFTYDALGRVVEERRGDGFGGEAVTTHAYATGLHVPTTIGSPGGGVTTVEYDARRRRTQVTRDGGAAPDLIERFAYDAFGNVVAREDALGDGPAYAFDGHGRLASSTDAIGRVTTWRRDLDGRPVEVTVEDGGGDDLSRTRYAYDAAGNLVRVERDRFDPAAPGAPGATEVTLTVYDLRGLPVLETDPCGATIRHAYDGAGRVVRMEEEPLGRVREFGYDAAGRLAVRREIRGDLVRETTLIHDAAGDVVSVTTPEGTVTLGRDTLGHAVDVADPPGRRQISVVDAAHRRLSMSEPDPAGGAALVRTWAWDDADRLVGARGPDGVDRVWTRDALGRVTAESRGGGPAAVAWARDAAGRTISRTDAGGTTVDFVYDAAGRVVSRAASTGATQTFSWDGNDRLVAGIDVPAAGPSVTIARRWDSLGNRLRDEQPGGTVIRTFGEGGGVETLTTPEGWTYAYERDAAGRVTSVERDGLGYMVYAYAEGSRSPSRRTHAEMDSTFTRDGRDRLVAAAHGTPDAPTLAASFTTSYDARGRRLVHARHDGKGERFEYDAAGRLVRHFMESDDPTSATPSGFRMRTDVAWAPGLSRPASTTFTDSVASAIAAASTAHPHAYDGAGRMTAALGATLTHDAAGRAANLVEVRPAHDAGGRSLAWDAFGRLREVRRTSNGTLLGEFRHDVLDRPVVAVEEQFTGIGLLTRRRVFDGCRLVSERSPVLMNPADGWDLFYVPEPAGRGHVASGFHDTFRAEYLWQTDCRDMPGHLYATTTHLRNESYRLWTALGLPLFETNLGAPWRGAPSLNTLTNAPGLASSHATGLVFSWAAPHRDPFAPRPLDPYPWGREKRVPFPGPPGPLPGPGGGDVGDPEEPDWVEVVRPEDAVEDSRCEDAAAELDALLETMEGAKERAKRCMEDLERVERERRLAEGKIEAIEEALDEILEAQEALRTALDRIRTADLVLNSVDHVVASAKQALDVRNSLKNLGKMGRATLSLFGGAKGKAADRAMDSFGEAFAEEVGGLLDGQTEGGLEDAVNDALTDAGILTDTGFSTVGAIDAVLGATGGKTTDELAASLNRNFLTGVANRTTLRQRLAALDRIERDRLAFKEYLRAGVAGLCARASALLDGLSDAWGESTAAPYRARLQALKAALAAAGAG